MVREHADEWHISKDKIGFLGFSAGGGVALFMEWKKAGANAELHMYGDGKGPYELMPQTGETTTETWSSQLIQWLKAKAVIK
jgi:dienelactone hydrolase